MRYRAVVCSVVLMCVLLSAVSAQEVRVSDSAELRAALQHLMPGTTVLLNPGVYQGGLYLAGVTGTEDAPVVIQGADPNSPPVFKGGGQAFHFADCSHLILRNIRVEGFPGNGINVDDGGSYETPAHHITLENVTIEEIGPDGNHDALKMSGVNHFRVRNCRFEGWGGSGIDMVGCHHGVVEDCVFVGREGFSQSNAIQLKGGTEDVQVFVNVGPGTSPETFVFRRNAWCDVKSDRRPSLPVEEQNGVYLSGVGAESYKRFHPTTKNNPF